MAFCVNRRDILVSPIREYSAREHGSTVVNSRTWSSYVPKSAVNNDARRMSSEKKIEEKFSTDHYSRDPSKDLRASFRQKSTICGDFVSTFVLSVSLASYTIKVVKK